MISFILHHILYKKKLLALFAMILIYIIFICVIVLTSDTTLERLLYPEISYMYYHTVSHHVMMLILATMIATIVFDFESDYDKSLYSYFGRTKIVVYKLTTHLLIVIMISLLMLGINMLVGITVYNNYDEFDLFHNIWVISDAIILFFWMLLMASMRLKQLSFFVVIIYFIMTLMNEDMTYAFLFYIFPIYHPIFTTYSLSIFYVFIYIVLISIMVYLKETNKPC